MNFSIGGRIPAGLVEDGENAGSGDGEARYGDAAAIVSNLLTRFVTSTYS
jgi:hypothetical protein